MEYIQKKYERLCNEPCDINEHLPTLYNYATKCESVLELGVRGCISSWALVKGLLENNKETKKIFLNDIFECNIGELLQHTNGLDVQIQFKWINDLDLVLPYNVDLTFIDTWHVYGQLKRELEKFSKITNKYIIMHDTTVDEIYGETIRDKLDANKQSIESGIPLEEINCGLGKAITEFLQNNSEWRMIAKYTNNNGLTILERI